MNTANKLTMLRVALIPVFLILLYLRFPFHMYFALTVFILASVTDFVDGYIARHYNQVTDFGKFMDQMCIRDSARVEQKNLQPAPGRRVAGLIGPQGFA